MNFDENPGHLPLDLCMHISNLCRPHFNNWNSMRNTYFQYKKIDYAVEIITWAIDLVICVPQLPKVSKYSKALWRYQMETFSAIMAICAGNSPVPGEFSA